MSEDPVDLRSLRTADCPGPEVEGNKQLEPLVEAKRIPSHWDSEGLARKAKEIEIGLKCLKKKKRKKTKKKTKQQKSRLFFPYVTAWRVPKKPLYLVHFSSLV